MAVKFNQYWDLAPGRRAEYLTFLQEGFLPVMEQLGIRIVGGWTVLVGEGPRLINEGRAEDLQQIQTVLKDPSFLRMRERHRRFTRNYTARILTSTGRLPHRPLPVDQARRMVKLNHTWNILGSIQEEEYVGILRNLLVPTLEELGLSVTAEWSVLVGSGPHIILECLAPGLEAVARALEDTRYHRAMAQLDDLVEDYGCRILVPHRLFVEALKEIHGVTLEGISDGEARSMFGPGLE